MNYNYTFPIDLTSNGIFFGDESVGKNAITIIIWSNIIPNLFLCVFKFIFFTKRNGNECF